MDDQLRMNKKKQETREKSTKDWGYIGIKFFIVKFV